jgi:DNA-3-methyladenine glycosylase
MTARLPRDFFAEDARTLARRLLGCVLTRVIDGERVAGIIVETEAYLGVRDAASHAFRGRRTPRNESMYARPGTLYVYFTYGMHHCCNVVCAAEGDPQAVLIRALEPLEGLERMRDARGGRGRLCSGPARLCQALSIDRGLDGEDLVRSARVFVESPPVGLRLGPVGRSPRIGVGYAGDWAQRPLRWFIRGNPHVSRSGARAEV